jgi:hypothetical protein
LTGRALPGCKTRVVASHILSASPACEAPIGDGMLTDCAVLAIFAANDALIVEAVMAWKGFTVVSWRWWWRASPQSARQSCWCRPVPSR